MNRKLFSNLIAFALVVTTFTMCDSQTEAVPSTPDEALAQIESKNYAIPYQSDGRRIVKIGVNFDSATRTIGEWKIVD